MKRKIIFIFLFILIFLIGFFISEKFFNGQIQSSLSQQTQTTQSISYYEPKKLIISKLDISTNIEPVGLDTQQRMAMPIGVENVGWYQFGSKPGENGSAVITGHLDDPSGPSVFYGLNRLNLGDEVLVVDDQKRTLHFEVIDKVIYSDADFPIATVFSQQDKPRLNLITCNGTFDKKTQSYVSRLVVYTELKSIDNL